MSGLVVTLESRDALAVVLAKRAERGDPDAKRKLVELADSITNKSYDELVRAVELFDWRDGLSFSRSVSS